MRSLFLSLLLLAFIASLVEANSEARSRRPANKWKTRGRKIRNRQLHLPGVNSGKGKSNDSGRSGDGFGRSSGKGGHFHVSDGRSSTVSSTGTTIYNSMGYTTETSALTTYNNKCDAAEAGAEYKTSSYIPVYYQYEVITSSARSILNIADIIDKACQHFLAVWMVDCDTTAANNGGLRQRTLLQSQRTLQMTLAPIVGAGVGDRDTVLLGETSVEKCATLAGSVAFGQACYKVIGSLLVYLDETMQVTPGDVQQLALETLTVGMNYGTTDFTQLDQDIFELQFIQGYGTPPEDVLEANWAANQRPWDANIDQENPFAEAQQEPVSDSDSGRSGGAKFGIAFATLVCIAIVAFIAVYIYKNRDGLFGKNAPRAPKGKNQNKHFNLDDQTQASTRYDPKKARVVEDDSGSHGEVNVTFRSFGGSRSPDADSVATRPLSPDPETPRPPTICEDDVSNFMEESNIVTPRSDWGSNRSTISEMTEPAIVLAETPDDRIRMNLSKETIRSSSRKAAPRTSLEYVSPNRSYQVEDTVQL